MLPYLSEFAHRRRIAFYDDLSHMNPLYVYPDASENLNLDLEVRRHIRNLRIISLYFDHIAIMYGNLLNYKNGTQKYILQKVIRSQDFQELCRQGVILFAGFGSTNTSGFLDNQMQYATVTRPELKDKRSFGAIKKLADRSSSVIREPDILTDFGVGDLFIDNFTLIGERMSNSDNVNNFIEKAKQSQIEHGYLGTLEYFPLANDAPTDIKKAIAFSYYDAWQRFSETRYKNIISVQSAYLLKINRTLVSTRDFYGYELPALVLSPEFFSSILKHFLTEKNYERLFQIDIEKLQRLKNGDWHTFVASYHDLLTKTTYAFNCVVDVDTDNVLNTSDIIDRTVNKLLLIKHDDDTLTSAMELTTELSKGTVGYNFLPKSVVRKSAQKAQRYMLRRLRFPEFRPFIEKTEEFLSRNAFA